MVLTMLRFNTFPVVATSVFSTDSVSSRLGICDVEDEEPAVSPGDPPPELFSLLNMTVFRARARGVATLNQKYG